jgi:hypothetical protein
MYYPWAFLCHFREGQTLLLHFLNSPANIQEIKLIIGWECSSVARVRMPRLKAKINKKHDNRSINKRKRFQYLNMHRAFTKKLGSRSGSGGR